VEGRRLLFSFWRSSLLSERQLLPAGLVPESVSQGRRLVAAFWAHTARHMARRTKSAQQHKQTRPENECRLSWPTGGAQDAPFETDYQQQSTVLV